MTLNNLINVVLGTAFTKDTTIAVKDFLTTNWPAGGAMSDTDLVAGNINFDTKFSRMDKLYHVIIEPMPIQSKFNGTGGSRYSVKDQKRIQILCKGFSAKDKKWKLEQQIYSMINANIRGMITDGIEEAFITDFQEIAVDSDDLMSTGLAQPKVATIARSRALVTLQYDMAIG